MSAGPSGEVGAAVRMDALARLAGGVAHDVNNVLMVISGYAEMLAESVADGDDRDAVQTILDAAERAATLTRQLLLFSRRQAVEPVDLPVATTVRDLEPLVARLLPPAIRLTMAADDPTLVARVDPGHVAQILTSLAGYVRDTLPGGGDVTIAVTASTPPVFVDASGDCIGPGDFVLLSVSDSGPGLDAATRARIFEPFFAPTAAGKSAGLALSTVYGIAKAAGGTATVAAAPGQGTTFEVYFPRVCETADRRDTTSGGAARLDEAACRPVGRA